VQLRGALNIFSLGSGPCKPGLQLLPSVSELLNRGRPLQISTHSKPVRDLAFSKSAACEEVVLPEPLSPTIKMRASFRGLSGQRRQGSAGNSHGSFMICAPAVSCETASPSAFPIRGNNKFLRD